MGAQVCGSGGMNVMSGLKPNDVESFESLYFKSSLGSDAQPAMEVAEMVAAERRAHGFESKAMVPVLFEVKPITPDRSPNISMATHRTTGMVRRLVSVQKPGGAERQERLRHMVCQLQALRCDGVARILEVFEDPRSFSLVMEDCTGGTVYDRILQRQYFAEQESAVLIRHCLQSLASLHRCGLSHGFPTPDSFRFQSEQTHASLKLVDFGLDLRVHLWDVLDEAARGIAEPGRRTTCLQLWETCHLVFGAPEVVKPQKDGPRPARGAAPRGGPFNQELMIEAFSARFGPEEDKRESVDSLADADAWGVGAIAFLLLCGYPPFFAPNRHCILARIENTNFSFDPPFWSKISEEAKDFVQRCLRSAPERRLSVEEALQHPWIQSLAEASPNGSMLSSFALNLRRVYKTSLIEVFAANSLAAKLSAGDGQELFRRCCDADHNMSGFLTATELRQILTSVGQSEIAEEIALCFSRNLRHPGESYIDYQALLESTRFRRERALEDELWRNFQSFDGGCSDTGNTGLLPSSKLGELLKAPDVQTLIARSGVNDPATLLPGTCTWRNSSEEVDFIDFAAEVIHQLPTGLSSAAPSAGSGGNARP